MAEDKFNPMNSKKNDETSFADMLQATFRTGTTIKVGETVEGKVISIGKESIFLDLGTRAEGMIEREEFIHKGQLTVREGDTLQVLVSAYKNGIFKCTGRLHQGGRNDARQSKDTPALLMLREAFASRLPVEGKVKSINKGGFEVLIMGQKAFCPISQIEKNYCQNPEIHLEKTYDFLVAQFEEEGRNIIVSRKQLLLANDLEMAQRRWQELETNQVIEGTITSVHDYGAFVDIGGIEGLLHVSEISYQKTTNAREALQPGQKLTVAIIKLDEQAKKVSLSLKALQADPWVGAGDKFAVGEQFSGKVVRLKTFGAFVELAPGVVGLLHISRLGANKRVSHPKEILVIDSVIQVRVLAVDPVLKTISLTMEEPEIDYSNELVQLKNKQDEEQKTRAGTMSDLLDSAIKNKTK